MQELREIAMSESVKGKHFFLESDIKGPTLKFDTTGKGILTVSISCLTSMTILSVELAEITMEKQEMPFFFQHLLYSLNF